MSQPFCPDPPLVLGILGGVGSGKSSLSALLAEHGLLVLDADREAARVLASEDMSPILQKLFGQGILGPSGPDRAAIAEAIFSDSSLRGRLEEAMHPRIRQALCAELDTEIQAGRSVVLDVPLLLEGGLIERCDRVLFLDVPDEIREERALGRGMSGVDWRRREAAQAPLGTKRQHADKFFDNSRGLGELKAQVVAWLEQERRLSAG